MTEQPIRRSRRLLKKETTTTQLTPRSRRHVNKPPLIIPSDDEEDVDVVYLGPKPSTLINLTSNPRKIEHPRNEKSPFIQPPGSPQKSKSKSVSPHRIEHQQQNEKSPFKKPPRTPQKTKSKSAEERLVTPPKQKKTGSNNENVPANTPTTPTVLLERLSLAASAEKNRRKLFEETDLYASARRALHSTCPTTMPGREKELGELREFILGCLDEERSGTMYISGPPGTGKTASLNLILEEDRVRSEIKEVYVNCTSINSAGAIFARIAKDLGVKAIGKGEKDYVAAIEKYLQRTHKTTLLVLDEIDQLESRNQSVLYTLFEWPSTPNSKLILIGIANALDLTDRILPRLQARCDLKPQLMHFAPYTKQQIVEIFTNRLKQAGVLDIFSPVALQMLAGKVAAVSGDIRRALDIGRRVIEMIDKRKKNNNDNVLKSAENLAEELDDEIKTKKVDTVDLKQVVSILNNVYGTSQNLDDEVDEAFPLQQKIIVCCLLLILKKAHNKDVTVGRLHEVYRRVCAKRNIQAVDQGEFVGICALIETTGIMRVTRKKEMRMSRVGLVWDEEEVAAALRDKQLMSMILQDEGCLGKL